MDTDKKETALEEQSNFMIQPYIIFDKNELENITVTDVGDVNLKITFI